jgi:hypothetical protein
VNFAHRSISKTFLRLKDNTLYLLFTYNLN